jgi:hypothetical protein
MLQIIHSKLPVWTVYFLKFLCIGIAEITNVMEISLLNFGSIQHPIIRCFVNAEHACLISDNVALTLLRTLCPSSYVKRVSYHPAEIPGVFLRTLSSH